jgi:hypothetical protein
LHRKFNKSLEREQQTAIDWAEETLFFSSISPHPTSITKAQLTQYFCLFKEQGKNKQRLASPTPQDASPISSV